VAETLVTVSEGDPLVAALEPGESLRWTGRPPRRAYMIGPSSAWPLFLGAIVLVLGVAAGWVAAASASSESGMIVAGFGMAALGPLALLLAGDVARTREHYGLTDRRLLIGRGGLWATSLQSLDLHALDGILECSPGLIELRLAGTDALVAGGSSDRAPESQRQGTMPAPRGPRLQVDDAAVVTALILEACRGVGAAPWTAGPGTP
jgi:hypothetical protein